jgi:hypothetical protein
MNEQGDSPERSSTAVNFRPPCGSTHACQLTAAEVVELPPPHGPKGRGRRIAGFWTRKRADSLGNWLVVQ